ncbi:MAG: DUF1688 family protein [Geminicoccaceae bacterium]|nr:DUF1688 family protein [Geminicoccaceae bacterium]
MGDGQDADRPATAATGASSDGGAALDAPGEVLDLDAVRERCWAVLARVERGASRHFELDARPVPAEAENLARLIARDGVVMPTGWGHLHHTADPTGGALFALHGRLGGTSAHERARCGFDLAALWATLHLDFARPSRAGLSLEEVTRLVAAGRFASDDATPCADAEGLRRFAGTEAPSAEVGSRLTTLASTLDAHPDFFSAPGRFGGLLDRLPTGDDPATIDARTVFAATEPLTPALARGGVRIAGRETGDVRRLEGIAPNREHAGLVPLHAARQQLVLDLSDPLAEAGVTMVNLQALTASATAASCDHMLTLGLVVPRHAAVGRLVHPMGSDIAVELRALTVALVDRLADRVRQTLDIEAGRLPAVAMMVPIAQRAAEKRDAAGGDRRPGVAFAEDVS